jgi:hypothetical protein
MHKWVTLASCVAIVSVAWCMSMSWRRDQSSTLYRFVTGPAGAVARLKRAAKVMGAKPY